jgi:hypothetical protein
MTSSDISTLLGGTLISALIVWRCWASAQKPRTIPKLPRDRSKDTRWSVFIGWFF